jgi:protein O-mannosyl-transferase
LSIFGTIIEILKANKIPYPMSKKNKTAKSVSSAMPKNDTQALNTISATPKDNTTLWVYGAITFLVIITFVAFWGGFDNEFVDWDDGAYITKNPLVKDPGTNWGKVWKCHVAGNYHPLTMVSLMINASIWGIESARSFIVTNTIIHLFNVLLVFWFILLLLKKNGEKLQISGKPLLVAFFTALIFAIHPMKVESVIWVSERKDVLYSFFFLLGSISYLKFLDSSKRVKYLFYCYLLLVLSCLAKGQAVVLPVIFILLDYWKGREFNKGVAIEKLPFLIISIIFGLIAINVQGGKDFYGYIQPIGEINVAIDSKFTLIDNFKHASYGFMMYLFDFFLPLKLSSFYVYKDDTDPTQYNYFLGVLISILALGGILLIFRKTKLIIFGMAYFLITFVLVSQLLSVGSAVMADRYTYLPYIGLSFIIVHYSFHFPFQPQQKIVYFFLISSCIFFFYLTRVQVNVWQNTKTLFTKRVELNMYDNKAHFVLGKWAGEKENDYEMAISESIKSIETGYNGDVGPWANLAVAYEKKGEYNKAIEYHNTVIQKKPTAEAFLNRGNTYLNMIQPTKALPDLVKALNMPNNTDMTTTRGSLANAQLNTGLVKEALENYNIVIDKDKSLNPEYFYNRGAAKSQLKDMSGAIEDIKICVKLKPDHEKGLQAMKLFGIK